MDRKNLRFLGIVFSLKTGDKNEKKSFRPLIRLLTCWYISGNTSASDIRKTIRERRRHKASSKKQSFEECERKKKLPQSANYAYIPSWRILLNFFSPTLFHSRVLLQQRRRRLPRWFGKSTSSQNHQSWRNHSSCFWRKSPTSLSCGAIRYVSRYKYSM